jgi:hypothetical protein
LRFSVAVHSTRTIGSAALIDVGWLHFGQREQILHGKPGGRRNQRVLVKLIGE